MTHQNKQQLLPVDVLHRRGEKVMKVGGRELPWFLKMFKWEVLVLGDVLFFFA